MAESRIDQLRRRVGEDPGSRLFAQLAEEHRKAGQLAEAARVARAGLAVHPAYPSARLTLGRALLASGDANAAGEELREALRQAPESILASRCLGQALEAAGDLKGALRQYRSTLELAPGDQEAAERARSVEARIRESGSAVGGASPASVEGGAAETGSAETGFETGAAETARAEPPPLSSSTLAELYLRQGFPEQAIEVYRRVLAEDAGNERASAGLREIEGRQAGERRRMLESTIDGLQALLGAVRRR